jgi:hypothetical protein
VPGASPRTDPMGSDVFAQVREMLLDKNNTSVDIARELKISLREVNVAIFSKSYEHYLAKRKEI